MKYLCLIIVVLFVSCNSNNNSNQKNINLIKKYYEAINSGDVSEAKKIVTDSFTKINNDKIFEENGIPLFVNSIKNHKSDNKKYKFVVKDIFGNNEKVSVRWNWESVNIKTGNEKLVKSQGVAIFKMKEGKIDTLWQGFDILGFVNQLKD